MPRRRRAALDIALTARGEHAGAPIPMCGVPVHAAEAYLARLIRRGFRVAVAEQMEDPKARTGKAPIRREVVRLVTPGTLTEDSAAGGRRGRTCCWRWSGSGARWGPPGSISPPGCSRPRRCRWPNWRRCSARLDPAEILAPAGLDLGEWAARRGPETVPPPPLAARRQLGEAFAAASLDAFGSFTDAEAQAAAAALDYVQITAGRRAAASRAPERRAGRSGVLAMDAATRASLEICCAPATAARRTPARRRSTAP